MSCILIRRYVTETIKLRFIWNTFSKETLHQGYFNYNRIIDHHIQVEKMLLGE